MGNALNKKGLVPVILVALILAVIALIILIFFVVNYAGILLGEGGKDVCRTRIEMASVKVLGINLVNSLSGFCPEEKVKISFETKEELYSELAQKMYSCWWRYGAGEKDFFDIWEKALEADKSGCLSCYMIQFKDLKIANEDLKYDVSKSSYYIYLYQFEEYLKEKFNKNEQTKNLKFAVVGMWPDSNRLYLNEKYTIFQVFLVPSEADAKKNSKLKADELNFVVILANENALVRTECRFINEGERTGTTVSLKWLGL